MSITLKKDIEWLLREKYHGVRSAEFDADIKRLGNGEPLAYVIGWVNFINCHVDLSCYPLIPRTETEFLFERAINELPTKKTLRILDMFSGSGCIGVACAKHLPYASVDLSDSETSSIEQININIQANNLDHGRVRAIKSDIFENIYDIYDVIFANPPYIDPSKYDTVQKSVLDFEPHKALFAEDRGLFYLRILIDQAAKHLHAGGACYIEFDPDQRLQLEKILSQSKWRFEFWRDQFDRDRFMVLRK